MYTALPSITSPSACLDPNSNSSTATTSINQIRKKNRSKWSSLGLTSRPQDTHNNPSSFISHSEPKLNELKEYGSNHELEKIRDNRMHSKLPSLQIHSSCAKITPTTLPELPMTVDHNSSFSSINSLQSSCSQPEPPHKMNRGKRKDSSVEVASEMLNELPSVTLTTSSVASILVQTCLQFGWSESVQCILKESKLDLKQHYYQKFRALLNDGSFHEVFKISRKLLHELEPSLSESLIQAGNAWLDHLHRLGLQSSLSQPALEEHVAQLWCQLDTYFEAQKSQSALPTLDPFIPFLAQITWPTLTSCSNETPSISTPHLSSKTSNNITLYDNLSKVGLDNPSPTSLAKPRISSSSSSKSKHSTSLPSESKNNASSTCKLQSVHEHLPISIHLMDVSLLNDELIVAFVGPEDKHVYFWNLTHSSWVHKWLPQSSKPIFFLSFSPSTRYLVTTDLDYDVTVYDWKDAKEYRKRKWHTRVIHRVFIPNLETEEVWISCSSDHSMKLWNQQGLVGRIHGTHPFVDVCVNDQHVIALQPYALRWYHRTTYTYLAQVSLTLFQLQKSPARRIWGFHSLWVSNGENVWSFETQDLLAQIQVHAGVIDVSSTTVVWSQRDAWILAQASPLKKKQKVTITNPCKHLKLVSTPQNTTWLVAAFEKSLVVYNINE